METPTFVLYHSNCPDGFGAAWAAWMALGDAATYKPVNYGKPLPELPDGARVYIVDFSFPREELVELAARCELTVLDHHATAQEALQGLPFATFDMQKSGAVLTWEHFHNEPVPEILLYVQDRDLWHWKLPNSKLINAALWRGEARNFYTWLNIHRDWEDPDVHYRSVLINNGNAISFSDGQMVETLCKHPHWMRVLCYTVPAVNSPLLQSEVGHQLLQLHPDAPFAVIYMTLEDGTFAYSLRARADDFDVSFVAKEFAGGGHKAAAGFSHSERFEIINKKEAV